MKLVLLVNRDLASTIALNYLLPAISGHDISVLMSDRVGNKKTRKPQALIDLSIVEQKILNNLIVGSPDARWQNISELADKYQFFVATENDINHAVGVERMSAINPDLIISIRYGVILQDRVIGIPRLGIINLHSGLLPDYRGVMATFWAMLNEESTIGTTLHYIDDASIDTGRVIGHTHLQVNVEKAYLDHVLELYIDGCQLIIETLKKLERGDHPATKPQSNVGKYFSFPSDEDLSLFDSKGLRLFDLTSVLSTYERFLPG